jgi:RNA polymerase sigma-70 factor (ECF subfamily)
VHTVGQDSFNSVLDAARAGGGWAWERIYRDLAPTVTGYLRAHGAAEPDDLAGETFLQIVRDLHRFSGDERAFRAWVFTIAHRRLVDDLRRRGRRPVAPASEAVIEAAVGAGDAADEAALANMSTDRVRAIVDELPGDQRAVMLLRILGDLTIEEIARAVGKRPGAVKALQRRALKRVERAYPFAAERR